MALDQTHLDKSLAASDRAHQNYLQVALSAARAGRDELLKYLGRLENVDKKFQAGLVTEADRAAEAAIHEVLKTYTPDFEFLGEESSANDKALKVQSQSDYRWIVDPLDGTTNYVHQFPFFAVSIGLEFQGKVVVGVVDAPLLNEVYCAVKNGGSYVNGKALRVSRTNSLEDAFVATGFHAEKQKMFEEQLEMFSYLGPKVRAVRRPGAASLDLCYLARGVFDLYYERGLQPWDSAAGAIIVEEAGGVVRSFFEDHYSPFQNSLLAGNPKLVSKFVDSCSHVFGSKDLS